MRIARLSAVLFAALLAAPASASAAVAHTVAPGETLWSIAAANNLTTRTVAAYNGLSESSNVVLGSTILVPTTVEGYAALQRAGLVASAPAASASSTATGAAAGSTASGAAAVAPTTSSSAPAPQGAYKVRFGDTLSELAASSRVSVAAIAAMNGLDPAGTLLAGTIIKLPSGAPAPPLSSQPAPATTVVPAAAPQPTPARLSASTIGQVAASNGVPASLAAAIAWQESGFNNGMVSAANARGVMQVMPGTWNYVETHLAGRPLDPASAVDNTTAGVLYLRRLLQDTGGDVSTAIAAYYQGLASVRSRGMFDDTKRYVANVEALQARFGG